MNSIIITLFLIRTLRAILYHLFWWERKEYRFDRMLVHLKETEQGRQWIFNPFSIAKWTLLCLPVFGIRLSLLTVLFVYALDAGKSIIELKNGWRKPAIRPRVTGIGIGATVLLVVASFGFGFSLPLAIILLLVDKLTGPSIAFFVFLSNRLFSFIKAKKMKTAKNKMFQSTLKVIGVTGSYGKTTTKEFIAQVLSSKYRVLKTIASQNTDIGIAELILRSDLTKYDYFICEMSAYGRGEIAAVCAMLQGKIVGAVITGINQQHQSLFKTMDTTMQSKFELIEAVNDGGFALFNGTNKRCKTMYDWAVKRAIKAELVGSDLFDEKKLNVDLPGEFFKENLALAVATGVMCKMSDTEIRSGAYHIAVPSQTMNVIKKGSVMVIDDSFNANPDGVYAAIEYLRNFKEKKIVVVQPLIELGTYAMSVHRRIGELAASICDAIIIANPNFNKPIMEGAANVPGGAQKVMTALPSWSHSNTVILFEGKESDKFMKEFKN